MINKVTLVGNVGKDPETKVFDNGVTTTQFSLATTKSWKDKSGERQEKTEWHNIVLWRGLAEVADKWVKKGDKLYLEGEITQRSWDKQDGTKGYITEIVCNEMKMLGGNKKEGGSQTQNEAPAPSETDNLPF